MRNLLSRARTRKFDVAAEAEKLAQSLAKRESFHLLSQHVSYADLKEELLDQIRRAERSILHMSKRPNRYAEQIVAAEAYMQACLHLLTAIDTAGDGMEKYRDRLLHYQSIIEGTTHSDRTRQRTTR